MIVKLNSPLKPNLKKLNSYFEKINNRGWYTNFGPLHEDLTNRLEEYLGVKNLLLVSNGTVAIQVACKTLNINSAITTPFSFVATSSSLLWQGIETKFSDIDERSYNLCPSKISKLLESNIGVDGIVATHVYGNPCNVKEFESISKKYNLKVVYDAAHAFGIDIKKNSVLNYGDASTLSFHATKVFHTIEGGAIIFKSKNKFKEAKQLINFGIDSEGNLGNPGINGKLNEYQCAVGLVLLDDIDNVLNHRSSLYSLYKKQLGDFLHIQDWHTEANYNGSYMPIYIESKKKQQTIISELNKNNIQCRKYFTPSLDTAYSDLKAYECSTSHKIAGKVICLPLHFYMTDQDVKYVSKVIKDIL